MLRSASTLLSRLATAVGVLSCSLRTPGLAAPRRGWRHAPPPPGPAVRRFDPHAWGAIRVRLGAHFGLVPA